MTALADLRPRLAEQVAARWGIPTVCRSHEELLQSTEVDAVVAITPRSVTAEVARAVLSSGKPLFTEKPIAGSHAEAEQLVELARERDLVYAVGTMRRYDPGYQYARAFIQDALHSKELGALTYARVHCFQGDDYCNEFGTIRTDEPRSDLVPPQTPDWIDSKRAEQFDRFHNVFCHDIDLLRYLVGDPVAVDFARMDPIAGRIAVFDHGEHGSVLEAGELRVNTWQETATVFFEAGSIEVTSPAMLLRNLPARVELRLGGDNPETRVPHLDYGWAFHRQAQAFVDAVRDGGRLSNLAEESLADLHWIEEIWRKEPLRCQPTV